MCRLGSRSQHPTLTFREATGTVIPGVLHCCGQSTSEARQKLTDFHMWMGSRNQHPTLTCLATTFHEAPERLLELLSKVRLAVVLCTVQSASKALLKLRDLHVWMGSRNQHPTLSCPTSAIPDPRPLPTATKTFWSWWAFWDLESHVHCLQSASEALSKWRGWRVWMHGGLESSVHPLLSAHKTPDFWSSVQRPLCLTELGRRIQHPSHHCPACVIHPTSVPLLKLRCLLGSSSQRPPFSYPVCIPHETSKPVLKGEPNQYANKIFLNKGVN